MDSLSQAVLGATMGEAVLGKRLGNRAILWGLLFGTLPDLDILFYPFLDTSGRLEFHRGASHSLLIMVLASILLARPLSKLWKKEKVSPLRAASFIFLAWSTHVLIDCFTTYGTSVLWPFSSKRISFDNLFIIDLAFTLPLLISIIWLCFYRTKKGLPKRKKILTYGLAISCLYVGISFGMKAIISSAIASDLANRKVDFDRRMEAPTPLNIFLWRAVIDKEDEFWVGYRSVFDPPSKAIRWTVYPQEKAALSKFKNEREIQTLEWFSKGWWIAREHEDGVWVADLRFGETRIHNEKPGTVDSRFIFAWSFLPAAEKDKLRTNRPNVRDTKGALKNLAFRIVGNQKIWEGNPRLSGVPGSLPVPLRVIE